jgi:all-trans-retinol 13,14-reductase
MNSYIESSYRSLGGGSTISNILLKQLKDLGAVVVRNKEVVHLNRDDKTIESAILKSGEIVKAKIFISNIHPTQTFQLFDTTGLRKSYTKRVLNLENTTSAFVMYIKLKPETYPYEKVNKYCFSQEEVWNLTQYTPENWGKDFAIYSSPSRKNSEFAESLIVITYMRMEEVEPWLDSYNTTTQLDDRSQNYQDFKENKAQILLDQVESQIPNIREITESYNTSTPLTLRDYIGADGSLYGINRDYNNPLKSFINTRTKLTNLYLTGQNLVMHGVLGVTIGAMVTCSAIIGKENLVQKIKEKL